MKFENIRTYGWEAALRGMRNPKESWHLSDTIYGYEFDAVDSISARCNYRDYEILSCDNDIVEFLSIGPNDMKLAQTLIKAGPEHRKFLRQIMVSVDITAPLYWFKEFDTYKVGTVANSTSTMHKIQTKPITLDCFEIGDFTNIEYPLSCQRNDLKYPIDEDFVQMCLIPYLEYLRSRYNELVELAEKTSEPEEKKAILSVAKKVWKELIRWLPEGWLQTRTVTMNYETLLAICSKGQRRFHKLNEWSGIDDTEIPSFIHTFARHLPYNKKFIFIDEDLDNLEQI